MTRGEFITTHPTLGMRLDVVKGDHKNFQVIDLGGQEQFRDTLWKKFVVTSPGLIFVLDSSEPSSLADSCEWFWKVVDWAPPDAVILFLANKIDKTVHMPIEEIITGLQLSKFAAFPSVSYRVMPVSAKTGEGVQEAWSWVREKLDRRFATNREEDEAFKDIVVFDSAGITIYDGLGTLTQDPILVGGFLSAVDTFIKEGLPTGGLEQVETGNHKVVLKMSENYGCAVIGNVRSKPTMLRTIGENVLQLVNRSMEKMVDRKDKHVFRGEELIALKDTLDGFLHRLLTGSDGISRDDT